MATVFLTRQKKNGIVKVDFAGRYAFIKILVNVIARL